MGSAPAGVAAFVKPLDAADLDQFSFKDDPYRSDVAAVGKVYRQYRGRLP